MDIYYSPQQIKLKNCDEILGFSTEDDITYVYFDRKGLLLKAVWPNELVGVFI